MWKVLMKYKILDKKEEEKIIAIVRFYFNSFSNYFN